MNENLSWEERYKQLEKHHVEETSFLIDKVRELAEDRDALAVLVKGGLMVVASGLALFQDGEEFVVQIEPNWAFPAGAWEADDDCHSFSDLEEALKWFLHLIDKYDLGPVTEKAD